jgi:dihydroorotate dehydrogenase electron transfer subunit
MTRSCASEILDNERLREGLYILKLHAPWVAETGRPGQFVMLRSRVPGWPYLGRPFSIYDSDGDAVIEIVYKVVGRATSAMAGMAHGDSVDLTGPLGTSFSPAGDSPHVVAVAGGIGLPPLGFYCKRYAGACESMTLVVGAKTAAELLVPVGLMAEGVEIMAYTEDGSRGSRGLATDGLTKKLESAEIARASAFVVACGPREMLGEVRRIAGEAGIACEVSVEEVMACGVGACMSCAVPAASGGYLHACKDGPVISASDIDFERWLRR